MEPFVSSMEGSDVRCSLPLPTHRGREGSKQTVRFCPSYSGSQALEVLATGYCRCQFFIVVHRGGQVREENSSEFSKDIKANSAPESHKSQRPGQLGRSSCFHLFYVCFFHGICFGLLVKTKIIKSMSKKKKFTLYINNFPGS